MIYGSGRHGTATFLLSAEEHEKFKRGESIVGQTADRFGIAKITIMMERPADEAERFPSQVYGNRESETRNVECP